MKMNFFLIKIKLYNIEENKEKVKHSLILNTQSSIINTYCQNILDKRVTDKNKILFFLKKTNLNLRLTKKGEEEIYEIVNINNREISDLKESDLIALSENSLLIFNNLKNNQNHQIFSSMNYYSK